MMYVKPSSIVFFLYVLLNYINFNILICNNCINITTQPMKVNTLI